MSEIKGKFREVAKMKPEEAIEIIKQNFPKTCRMVNGRYQGGFDDTECDFGKALLMAIEAIKEIQQYREIGTVEECREAVEKLKRAEEALNVILSGNYNDECNFCVHNDNPMANCQCICGDGSWCIHNAKWNGKTSEDENLEGMEDENT